MGYFGGLGAGKGWRKLRFLISPEELDRLLTSASATLVRAHGRVPLEYLATPITEYVDAYRAQLSEPDTDTDPTRLHISLMLPGTRYEWRPVVARRKRDEGFKVVELYEPVVNLAATSAMWCEDGRLYFGVIGRTMTWIGLEMHFPKVVSYDTEKHEILHDVSGTANAGLFDFLSESVHRVTRPAAFQTPSGARKTTLRVSDAAAQLIQGHPGLARQGLGIVLP